MPRAAPAAGSNLERGMSVLRRVARSLEIAANDMTTSPERPTATTPDATG